MRLLAAAIAASVSVAIASLPCASAHVDVDADLAAARAHQLQARWAPSESLATAVLARLETDPEADSLQMAEALYMFARAKRRRSGYTDPRGFDAAVRSLAIRTRNLGPEHLDAATSHLEIGRWLLGKDDPDRARAHVRRCIDIRLAGLASNDTLISESWDQLALICRDSGDFRGALDAWGRTIAIRQAVDGPESPEVARLLAQTGVPWMALGDLHKAREVLERSLALFERNGGRDHPSRWIPLNILADVELQNDNDARSLDLQQEALRVVIQSRGAESREALTLRGNVAVSLEGFGDFEGARAMRASVLPALRAQYGAGHIRTLAGYQGLAYANSKLGEPELALRQFAEIESLLAVRGQPPGGFLSSVQLMESEVLYRLHRDREAREMAERAIHTQLAASKPSGHLLADAHELLILALESLGDFAALDSAQLELSRIIRTYDMAPSRSAGIAPHFRSRAARRLGRRDEALPLALEAEQQQREMMRLSILALPDRRALQSASRHDMFLELVMDLSRGNDPERLAIGWDRLVRSRGLVRATLGSRRAPQGLESDSAVARALTGWTSAQRAWAKHLVSASAGRDSVSRVAAEALRQSAEDAEGAYANLLASRHVTAPVEDIGLADVRARLGRGQALVAFYESRGSQTGWLRDDTTRVIAFVARGGDPAIDRVELGYSASLQASIDAWRERLALPPSADPRAAERAERECRRWGREVGLLTWDRIAPRVAGASDVFLVGDGPLLDLAWHALPDREHGYLVEAGPRLHLLNSERELTDVAVPVASGTMLAIGAPDFASGTAKAGPSTELAVAAVRASTGPCAGGLPSFVSLPGTAAEVDAVAREWRANSAHSATVLMGAEASEEAFKSDAPGHAVLHLATHGVVTSDICGAADARLRGVGEIGPLVTTAKAPRPARKVDLTPKFKVEASTSPWMARRVWLAFAGASRANEYDRDENEGLLTAEEVITMDLTATDWVVLSACHSGFAEAWSREGALGMRRAFSLAGARSVIASQWSVDDDATTGWMRALYAARARGATNASAAVELASRAVLAARRAGHQSTHPFYWAAFTASGE